MKEYPSTAITRQSGEILDAADKAPVAITRYRRPRYVLMSAEHYARLLRKARRRSGGDGEDAGAR